MFDNEIGMVRVILFLIQYKQSQSKSLHTAMDPITQHIQTHLPLLHAAFYAVNPIKAEEWTKAFAQAGITDDSFPATDEAMKSTCEMYALSLSPIELNYFQKVQYQYFSKLVENGCYIEYPNDKPTPYKPVYASGFPVSGTFGQVEKVVAWADVSKCFARKRLLHIDDSQKHRIEKEVLLLQNFRHPHSINFHGIYTHQHQIFLVFDFADMNLRQFFRNPSIDFMNLPPGEKASQIVNWMIDMSTALADFHAIGGIHRDIKLENILIRGRTLLLADFGLATVEASPSTHVASIHGTETYMAPEQGFNKNYGRSADVFAMGCIFLEFLTFARNISVDYFENFRRLWGNQSCQFSNACYRHNLQAVQLFISTCLRGKSETIEPLVDMIEFDVMAEKPFLRIAARDVRQRLLVISEGYRFFKKSECCSGGKQRFAAHDASMKSLIGRMGSLLIEKDMEAMEIDLGGSVGPLEAGFF